jgi:hypothetical protein
MPLTPEELADLAARYDVSPQTARRYLQAFVTLPDGRQIRGQAPGTAGVQHPEHVLRDVLARQLRGITEALLPYGRADVATATHVFEVESAPKWREGVRQVLAYAAQCGLAPAVALFGPVDRVGMLKLRTKLCQGRPPVELWWWGGRRWEQITANSRCRNFPVGATFEACTWCRASIVWLSGADGSRFRYSRDGARIHHCPGVCNSVGTIGGHFRRTDCPPPREHPAAAEERGRVT